MKLELIMFPVFFDIILIYCFFSVRKSFINRNKEILKNAIKTKAIIYEVYDITGRSGRMEPPRERSLSNASVFIGERHAISNCALVEIADTKEHINCTFPRLATRKNYPSYFTVYIGQIDGKRECYSGDYFTAGLMPLNIIGAITIPIASIIALAFLALAFWMA